MNFWSCPLAGLLNQANQPSRHNINLGVMTGKPI
jgi:hypothetical protein